MILDHRFSVIRTFSPGWFSIRAPTSEDAGHPVDEELGALLLLNGFAHSSLHLWFIALNGGWVWIGSPRRLCGAAVLGLTDSRPHL